MNNSQLRNRVFASLDDVTADAKAKIEARRGCAWINRLIVALAEAVKHCGSCADFYRGKTRITPDRLIAHELQQEHGLLRYLTAVRENFKKLSLPDNDEINALYFAASALEGILNEIGRFANANLLPPEPTGLVLSLRDLLPGASAERRIDVRRAINGYLWGLAEAAYRLSIAEYRIWYEHRDWEIYGYESDPNGPYDVRGVFDNLYLALKRYDEDYSAVIGMLWTSRDGLTSLRDDLPVAFVSGDAKSNVAMMFGAAVRTSLTLPVRIYFKNPVEVALGSDDPVSSCEPSGFFSAERIALINQLNALFQERAKLAADPAVRRKWYEAAAELVVDPNWGQPVFTPEQADQVVTLANAAQREAWILRKMGSPRKAETLPTSEDQPLPAPASTLPPLKIETRLGKDADEKISKLIELIKAPKPGPGPGRKKVKETKPKNPRAGSGLHGTRTKKMEEQISAFKAYLLGKPITKTRNIGYWAGNFWKQEKCAAAARAKGENRGYAKSTKLASAYHSWKRAQKQKPKKGREKSRN